MHTPCVYINVMLPSVSILPICDGKIYPEIVSGAIYPFSVIVGNTFSKGQKITFNRKRERASTI